MAIRAWMDGDLRLALRLLQWAQPDLQPGPLTESDHLRTSDDHSSSDWLFQPA
jgi:hypothetical protein